LVPDDVIVSTPTVELSKKSIQSSPADYFLQLSHPPDKVKRELASYSDVSPIKSFLLAFVVQILQSQIKPCPSQKKIFCAIFHSVEIDRDSSHLQMILSSSAMRDDL
jgi:hypothetical protein